jgi:hypothetical protein
MRSLVGASLAAAVAIVAALGLAAGGRSAPAAACPKLTVAATIEGKRVCLKEGARCVARLDAAYRRNAFFCSHGRLVGPWTYLRRPLGVPHFSPGSPCPVSPPDPRGDLKAIVGWGAGIPAWGSGPAYPVLLGFKGPVQPEPEIAFELPPPPGFGGSWGVSKAVWFTEASYAPGRVLVRGRQLDGTNEVRFEDGRPAFTSEGRLNPATELRLVADGSGHQSTTRLRSGGCYAYQLDGRTFTRIIVFRAIVVP